MRDVPESMVAIGNQLFRWNECKIQLVQCHTEYLNEFHSHAPRIVLLISLSIDYCSHPLSLFLYLCVLLSKARHFPTFAQHKI